MNATDESAFYRAQGQQQADAAWEAKGAGLSPAVCAKLLPDMDKWAEERCGAGNVKQTKEVRSETSRLHERL